MSHNLHIELTRWEKNDSSIIKWIFAKALLYCIQAVEDIVYSTGKTGIGSVLSKHFQSSLSLYADPWGYFAHMV